MTLNLTSNHLKDSIVASNAEVPKINRFSSALEKIPEMGTDYQITRFLFLRLLGWVYLFAFLTLVYQGVPLLGENGILPAERYLDWLESRHGSSLAAFMERPTLFLLGISDDWIVGLACLGASLSLVVLAGFANMPILALQWALYMSFVHIGQRWYGYGWEIQLLETGFLAIFLAPVWEIRPFPRRPPPIQVIWLLRWMAFRIYLGAGLIKIRGDECWRDLTCLFYHFETQPLPHPFTPWFHFLPQWALKFGTFWNHLVELAAPFLVFFPRIARYVAGVLLVTFQIFLILSGNLSFLNWLTILPALACFDDAFWRALLPKKMLRWIDSQSRITVVSKSRNRLSWALVLLIAWLSFPVIQNLVSKGQLMNTSFNPLHLVNTYGAFGSVGKVRKELILKGTTDAKIDKNTVWQSYEFKAKPGDPNRPHPWISPYHHRVDWQIWFAAMSQPNSQPWLIHMIWKLLQNDPGTLSLIATNPFPDVAPKFIKVDIYEYHLVEPGSNEGIYWERKYLGNWLSPLALNNPNLRKYLSDRGMVILQ